MTVIIDTGPLIAALSTRDTYHIWAKEKFLSLPKPFLTTAGVWVEASYMLTRYKEEPHLLYELISANHLKVNFMLNSEIEHLRVLQSKYKDIPMSYADASLVRMSEFYDNCKVLTIDSDFRFYRRNKTQAIPTILPG